MCRCCHVAGRGSRLPSEVLHRCQFDSLSIPGKFWERLWDGSHAWHRPPLLPTILAVTIPQPPGSEVRYPLVQLVVEALRFYR